ncbi:MAG TPA: alpha-amylase family glycosyl hydrolase [Tepidisphaeraceae bacterium]|jgi:1,4-alpha-glucan branching enzyme|nr:alpha-amylase family glycosyl hydrolase [Tepidisphaeraceae bacterium]
MTQSIDRTTDGTGLIDHDPWLEPYADKLRARFNHYKTAAARIQATGGLTGQISQGHHYFGLNRGEFECKPGVWYREWAPEALQLRVIGDFNHWERYANPMVRDQYGVWSVFLPDEIYGKRLVHGSRVKVLVITEKQGQMDRLPAYIRRVVQEPGSPAFTGLYWNPPAPYEFKNKTPALVGGLRIYEAHIGMAQEEGKVGTFDEFTAKILPRVASLGYNALQLMAIQEHPYYGSFGYHVSNFFAVSSRFGTPEQLKHLIDVAHGMGVRVLMDIVHSHAVRNTQEGLNLFDGTDHLYFHAGPRGQHVAWDSLLFDYAKYEVQRFLLSNVRYWLDEFHFDGFRFDGVTSMLYLDHGLGKSFGSYDDYLGDNVDPDALTYLQLANQLAHTLRPDCITIAEDMSGMVGTARPVPEGGLGFDYRLAMGVPDNWIKLLKEKSDEQWNLGQLYHTLMNRRYSEKHIGYAESHDQALVGDKTLAFWLMDKEMYWHMDKASQSLIIDRGIALHKMIRLITFSLAGEGYLNFIGNEFGHPEWVDFPREGNRDSYHHARRQWSLVDDPNLRYKGLNNFDSAMMRLDEKWNLLNDKFIEQLMVHEEMKLLEFRRGPLVFIFNFHPTHSYTDLRIAVPDPKDYLLELDTDAKPFEGQGRIAPGMSYPWQHVPCWGRNQSVQIYLPSRSAQVLAPV